MTYEELLSKYTRLELENKMLTERNSCLVNENSELAAENERLKKFKKLRLDKNIDRIDSIFAAINKETEGLEANDRLMVCTYVKEVLDAHIRLEISRR